MKKILLFLLFFLSFLFCQSIKERIEMNILKKISFQNYEILVSKLGPFIIKKDEKEFLNGGFFLVQGYIEEQSKIRFTHEEWQFNDFGGKLKGEIISETPLTIKIDSTGMGKNTVEFLEEITIFDKTKTIKLKYEFKINKETQYPVTIYVNFNFPDEVIKEEIDPFIDQEKVIYETKIGNLIISFGSEFLPEIHSPYKKKNFRVYIGFPQGLKKGEIKKGEIIISLF